MRTLVTGANGFIGSKLVSALLERGDSVRVLVRPTSDLKLLGEASIDKAEGDVTDPESVARAMASIDVVFHLAGIRRTPHVEDFAKINVEGTRHVLQAAAAQPHPPRVVLAGSLSAAGPSSEVALTEDSPLRPVEPYGRSKAEAEALCRTFAGRVPFTVGRAPRVLGGGDRENLPFVKLANRGVLLELSGPPRPISFIDVDDVARGFIALGTHPAAVGEAFFITSPETLTLTALQEIAAEALGKLPRVRVPVSSRALRSAAWVADHISKRTGRHLPLNHKLAEQLLAAGWWCSGAKAQDKLGFFATTRLHESVTQSAHWYRAHGWL